MEEDEARRDGMGAVCDDAKVLRNVGGEDEEAEEPTAAPS